MVEIISGPRGYIEGQPIWEEGLEFFQVLRLLRREEGIYERLASRFVRCFALLDSTATMGVGEAQNFSKSQKLTTHS